ncbi:hypothetical protein Tco_1175677 [Tanacetum coccineum]
MENEHELSYKTLTRVYVGSYENHKGVVAGSLRIHIEQRIAAMMGYRGGSGGCFEMKEDDVLRLCDEYEGLWRLDKQGGRFWKGFEAAARIKPQGDDVALFRAMEWLK